MQWVDASPQGQLATSTALAKQDVRTALSVGNIDHAKELLDRAFRADPDSALLYDFGLVAQAQGRSVAALDLYRRYQASMGAASNPESNRAIEQLASSLTSAVTVMYVTSQAGMRLVVDGQIVGTLPLRSPLLLAGGSHRFGIEDRNERYESGALSIPESREAELRLTPGARGTAVALLSLSPITLFVLSPRSLPSEATQALHKALMDAARRNHLAPFPVERLALHERSASCLERPDCQFSVAELAQARSVIRAEIKDLGDPDADLGARLARCSVQLQYLDVNTGQVAASGATASTACAGLPLTEAVTELLQQLLADANSRPRGMVAISSVPDGAQVRVDGLLRGVTPYLKASFSGAHEIVVEKESFDAFPTKVEVVAGNVTAVQVSLVGKRKEPSAPIPGPLQVEKREWHIRQQPRPRWRLALGGIALGSGALLASFGIPALVLDGQCVRAPADGVVCDTLYSSGGGGSGLLGAGLALTVGGLVLLAVPSQRERVSVLVASP